MERGAEEAATCVAYEQLEVEHNFQGPTSERSSTSRQSQMTMMIQRVRTPTLTGIGREEPRTRAHAKLRYTQLCAPRAGAHAHIASREGMCMW